MQAMESQFDVCTEDLFNQTIKLKKWRKRLVMLRVKCQLLGADSFCCRKTMRNKRRDSARQP